MSKSFSNPTFYNSGKPSFGTTNETSCSSDYLRDKKAKLLYKNNNNSYNNFGRLGSQNNYLLYDRAKIIKDVESCDSIPFFNKSNLVSGLYSIENLGPESTDVINNVITGGVNVITSATFSDLSCNIFTATTVDLSSGVPFYYNYKIDPCGLLFGNTPCGYDNYEKFRINNKPVINTSASLTGCTNQNNILVKSINKKSPIFNPVYLTTGDPDVTIINGLVVLTFTKSGSLEFQGSSVNVGYVVVGGGGAGGGGADGAGWGGGGAGGGVSYLSTINQTLTVNTTYNITIGSGGMGDYNANGGDGGPSSIIGNDLNVFTYGGKGGSGGSVNYGIGGTSGDGGGDGGTFSYSGPLTKISELNYSSGYPIEYKNSTYNMLVNYKLKYGESGTTIDAPIIRLKNTYSNGGGAGWANSPGSTGSLDNGAGITLYGDGKNTTLDSPSIIANGYDAYLSDYGCGGGGSGGGLVEKNLNSAYSGGNGAQGVVIIWFFS